MAKIIITSKDADRIARTFNDMISRKGLSTIRRRVVNAVGADVRLQTRAIGPELFGTSAAALSVKGQAAPPGTDDPFYSLKMATSIPIARLRAKHRRAVRRDGKTSLEVDTPAIKRIRFRAVQRIGKAFKLLKAGDLPERFVGGVARSRRAFADPDKGGYADLAQLRRKAERDLPIVMREKINDFLKRRRKR